MTKKTWEDVERAALYNIVLHEAVTRVSMGQLTREEALIAASLTLARICQDQHDALVRELSNRTHRDMTKPLTPHTYRTRERYA